MNNNKSGQISCMNKSDYKRIAEGVAEVLNKLRKDPQSFISKLEGRLKNFKGSSYKPPGKSSYHTEEGTTPVKSLIQTLKQQEPLSELQWSDGIAKACLDHANDIGEKGLFVHKGSDGSSVAQRMTRYGQVNGQVGETIDFYNADPEEIVISLIIDDGNQSKSNRTHILNSGFRFVGVASASHAETEICTVINFSSEHTPKSQGKLTDTVRSSVSQIKSSISPQKDELNSYDSIAKSVFELQNQVRRNPKSFTPKLKDRLKYFEGLEYKVPGQVTIITSEGARACEEAIKFLEAQPSLAALKSREGITKAAKDHANDIGSKGLESHTGSDNSKIGDRLDRYGRWMGKVGESINFSTFDPEEVIMDLIISDGELSRSQRNNIFNPDFVYAGISACKHQKLGICLVINYAQEFSENDKRGSQKKSGSKASLDSSRQPTSQISLEGDIEPKYEFKQQPQQSWSEAKPEVKQDLIRASESTKPITSQISPKNVAKQIDFNTQAEFWAQSKAESKKDPLQGINFDKLARQVFEIQNRVRKDPRSLISGMLKRMKHFDGLKLRIPDEVAVITAEGISAWEEAIAFLRSQPPAPELKWNDNIVKAARDHAEDIGPKGLETHTGTDGSKVGDRLDRYGKWLGKVAENIDFCSVEAEEIIMDFIIDDGNPDRGHRTNLFDPNYLVTGVSIAKHSKMDICVVVNYASEFQDYSQLNETATKSLSLDTDRSTADPFSTPPDKIAKDLSMDSDNLLKLSKDVFNLQNSIRKDPKSFISKLEQNLRCFKGNVLHLPGYIPLSTEEGAGAYYEAIAFLQKVQPIEALEWDDNIAKACLDHALDIGHSGSFSHTGSDSSSMISRLERYGKPKGYVGESMDFASFSKEDIMVSLIVDDGNTSRSRRKNLFNTQAKKGAIAISKHVEMHLCVVLNYVSDFLKNDEHHQRRQKTVNDYKARELFSLPILKANLNIDAEPMPELQQLAKEVFHAQNKIRKMPQSFIPLLEEKLTQFQGTILCVPGRIPLITSEGSSAIREAMQFLRDQKSLPEFTWNEDIARVAQNHAEDIGSKGSFSHTASNGSTLSHRIGRHGAWSGRIAENIDFGSRTANEVVLSLLVDDGNHARAHRKVMFSNYTLVGLGTSKHAEMDTCVVIDYATEFKRHSL